MSNPSLCGNSDAMIHRGTAIAKEARALHAALFCLAVLAQLMLPAAMMRAEALAGSLCVTSDGGADSGSSKSHGHGKPCADCRLHCSSPFSPPTINSVLVERADVPSAAINEAATTFVHVLHAQPPSTGPPPV
jgi:hypothetical protein